MDLNSNAVEQSNEGNLVGAERRAGQSLLAMPLDELRDAKRLTQVQLAQLLQISQGAVSKVERRSDMFVSTLRSYVRAIGGVLEIRAVFPEGDVLIDQFDGLKGANPNRQRTGGRSRDAISD